MTAFYFLSSISFVTAIWFLGRPLPGEAARLRRDLRSHVYLAGER